MNPHITKAQASWFQTFGKANADRFDARGFSYFIREVYDSFYPGYGESWPIFHGAVGMTYEQASARGLVFRREDDSDLTYRDGVLHHFTAAITTAETAARNREKLLRDFVDYRRTAIAEGESGPVKEYVLTPGADPSRAARLARLLATQGFDVRRADAAFKVGTKDVAAGAYIVPVAQPSSRLLRNLMDTHIPQPEAFVKEQDRRRKKRLDEQIYDVTAWSLPLAFDVEVLRADRPTGVKTLPVIAAELPWALTPTGGVNVANLPAAKVGYLLPWGSGTATTIIEALRAGLRVRSADLPFTLGGRQYPGGTAIVRVAENPADTGARLGAIAAKHGVEVVPIDSAFVEQGISLGSGDVSFLKLPRVLLAWDTPTQSLSAGWARFVLERRFGQPVTTVRTGSLGRVDLRKYDVLVLPSGTYAAAIGGDALRRLKDWINAGGTLVTLAEASRWAARENVGLLGTTTELRGGKPETDAPAGRRRRWCSGSGSERWRGGGGPKGDAASQPISLEKAIEPERERPAAINGAFLRVNLDLEHWLAAGTDGQIAGLVDGQRIFTPLKLDKGRNVARLRRPRSRPRRSAAWSGTTRKRSSRTRRS